MIFDSFRARVGVVVINNGQILLVRDKRTDTPTYHLPGDVVKVNESLEYAAKRAVKEQAGVDIDVGKLLYVRDGLAADRHRLDLFFVGKLSGIQELVVDKEHFRVDWINLSILESMDLYPKFLRKSILKDYKEKFREAGIYVGALE
jgi:8-oxo-dGTP diphosphatase